MKKTLVLFAFLMGTFVLLNAQAQAPNWDWGHSSSGSQGNTAYSSTTDFEGNVIVAGEFYSPTVTIGSTTLTNLGICNILLAKYDATGTFLWATSAGGSNVDGSYSVTTDPAGNIFISGVFYSSTITIGTQTLTNVNAGNADAFLAKYSSDGAFQWATSLSGMGSDAIVCISADNSGNVYATGNFSSASLTIGSTSITNSGDYDLFIAKFDASGNTLWANSLGGLGFEEGRTIRTDNSGNIYVAGNFTSSSINFGIYPVTNSGNQDVFVAKFDATGNALWATGIGGSSNENVNAVEIDNLGGVYLAGGYNSEQIIQGLDTIVNEGSKDILLIKCDAETGITQWVESVGGLDEDEAFSVAADDLGNLYLAGAFKSSTIYFAEDTLSNRGDYDICLFKYAINGTPFWAKSAGGTSYEIARSVSIGLNRNVFVVGFFSSLSCDFDSFSLDRSFSTGHDVFLAKLDAETVGFHTPINQKSTLAFYPNPCFTHLNIAYLTKAKRAQICIYNILGELIIQQDVLVTNESVYERIDISKFPSGAYLLCLRSETDLITESFIKQ